MDSTTKKKAKMKNMIQRLNLKSTKKTLILMSLLHFLINIRQNYAKIGKFMGIANLNSK
jgi:hypothetical protein